MKTIIKSVICIASCAAVALCQQNVAPSDSVSKSTTAIGYQVGGGSTQVDLKATDAMPQASGEAKVEAKSGVTTIEAKVKGLTPASRLGTELLTYVLWVVSPDGRTSNLGEIQIKDNGEGELKATTQLQTFSLIVTAEPYYAVRQPNEAVVLENALRKGTKGKIYPIKEYRLMKRAHYQKMGNPLALTLDVKNVPLEMYEARNAVEIAKSRGAEKYAPEIFTKADGGMKMAENALARKANRKEVISAARSTVQFAEDARALAAQRQEEERIAAEKAAAAAKAKAEAEAKAAAEAAEAKRKADLEAQRQAELAAAKQAQMKAEADAAAARAKAAADAAAAKAKAEADALRAKEEAAKAEAERARQAAEQLRAQLLDSLNRVLETKDTPRGLVVTMADVLFDTGKYDLRGPTREKLARLSGIILANKGLNLEIEGHTDSTGSDELNQKLSEQRASTVRTFLVEQGLAAESVTSKGYGKTMPVADNATAAGRQANRRVEIIVSGEVIGTKIGR
ncbi:MAG: OmpA family protein [Bryobacteraceae bacterium]|nr:OmpA family protein [Bryobacteraceae bacterium]